ncbi:MAG: Rrf2 family transcriptional regulator [Balneolaceae bacterium]|nr:Rrf2 family transcriptional regulator [Balneolaceae bacterium]
MLLSKSCVYGLRASLYLASKKNEEYIPIRIMSDKLEISFHFLTKILQQLTAEEILESFKGPNGGVRLKKPGTEIPLMDIVLAIDGPQLLTECALGLPGCGTKNPCPLHDKWAETRDSIRGMLEDTTLKELVEKGKAENLRLTTDGGFDILFDDGE